MRKKRLTIYAALALFLSALLPPLPVSADAVTDTIGVYVGYYGWPEEDYKEKVTCHWTDLDDWYGGALDTQELIYSYYSGSRTYLVAARGFYIRDLLQYAGVDFGSIASIDFFTQDHANGAYRSFSKYSLFDLPRYYFPNLAANEETGELYPYDGDDLWNGATAVEAMLALEDYTEWDAVGSEFEQRYDPNLLSPNCRFHLFFGQSQPAEASTSSAAKYCYKILVTFSGTPRLSTEETDMTLKIGSGRKIEVEIDAEDGLLNDYVRENITWASSDESVVSVAPDGTLTVLAEGAAVITASFGQSSVSVNVTVGGEETAGGTAEGDGGEGIGDGEGGGTAPQTVTTVSEPQPTPAPEPEPEPAPEPTPETEEDPQPGVEIELPPMETVAEELSGKQVFTVSPQALLGLLPGSAAVEDQSGGKMDEDSVQLELTEPERADDKAYIAAALGAAFVFGFGYEIIRFRRMLRG